MKKNNGFTLIELLATIIILVAIALVAFPILLNTIKNSEGKIDKTTEKLVLSAAKLYINDNLNEYPKKSGSTYCIPFNKLIEEKHLEKGILDAADVDSDSKVVKVTVTDNYQYEVKNSDECQNIIKICEAVTEETKTTGNIPEGNFNPGDEYICEVKKGTKYNFFVLSTEEDKVNLIMDSNITRDGRPIKSTFIIEEYSEEQWNMWRTPWYNDGTISNSNSKNVNNNGPVTALEFLDDATKNWDNISDLNYNYEDENGLYNTIVINQKARMPKKSEINNLFIDEQYSMDNFNLNMLPIWATNYLYNLDEDTTDTTEAPNITGRAHVSHMGTYWLMDSFSNEEDNKAYEVGFDSGQEGASVVWAIEKEIETATPVDLWGGVRPVITISKQDIN